MLRHSVVQFRESNQAKQSSEQQSKHAAPHAHALILQTLTAVDRQRSRPEAQTQPILSADWFTEMTDLNGCPLKLFLFAVQDSECACAQHY